jgi:hypothetical protein
VSPAERRQTPFSFAACEAIFGPECMALVEEHVREAPRLTPEQILRGRQIFATFRVPPPASADDAAGPDNADD